MRLLACVCWDSWKGVRTRTKRVKSMDGRVTVAIPELARDIALKIIRAE